MVLSLEDIKITVALISSKNPAETQVKVQF